MHRSGGELQVTAPDGVPEVGPGDDLAELAARVLRPLDGDVVVVTSKVVSKAEGRVLAGDDERYEQALAAETTRVVARRGRLRIVRHRLGLVMAAAGIDRSNVAPGHLALLPLDPDASARRLREDLHRRLGVNVGVVVTDTFGRAWREGQTDVAIGVAGMLPLESFVGRRDGHGNELAVTLPAVADELAGAAELAQGKLGGRPLALVRGRADLVLPAAEHGPGAAALQRPEHGDLFGLGAREAVVAALSLDPGSRAVFGAPAATDELAAALRRVAPGVDVVPPPDADAAPSDRTRGTTRATTLEAALPSDTSRRVVEALCLGHGWRVASWRVTDSGVVAVLVGAGP